MENSDVELGFCDRNLAKVDCGSECSSCGEPMYHSHFSLLELYLQTTTDMQYASRYRRGAYWKGTGYKV